MTKNEVLLSLIDSLTNKSEEWKLDRYEAKHSTTGIVLWIANGILHLSVTKPVRLSFGFVDTIKLYRAVEKCKCNQLTKSFNK